MPQQKPRTATARLSFQDVEVEVTGPDDVEVSVATDDYLRWCSARLGVDLSIISPQVLAFVANSRNQFQWEVRKISPRSHLNRQARGK